MPETNSRRYLTRHTALPSLIGTLTSSAVDLDDCSPIVGHTFRYGVQATCPCHQRAGGGGGYEIYCSGRTFAGLKWLSDVVEVVRGQAVAVF